MAETIPVSTCPNPGKWLNFIARRIRQEDDCWVWTGQLTKGYGRISVLLDEGETRRMIGAHRASWLAHRGDIPEGLVVDHLCRNRACVNPWHMELVTCLVNTQRGVNVGAPRKDPDAHACKIHGKSDGFLREKGGYYYWTCRICSRVRRARFKARRAAAVTG